MRWPFGRSYEAWSLNRDARNIAEDAEARFSPERMREFGRQLGTHLDETRARLQRPGTTRGSVLIDLRRCHREAKRQGLDMPLSALTLAIIHVRAQRIGPECEPAVQVIERLRAAWDGSGGEEGRSPVTLEA